MWYSTVSTVTQPFIPKYQTTFSWFFKDVKVIILSYYLMFMAASNEGDKKGLFNLAFFVDLKTLASYYSLFKDEKLFFNV